MESSDAVLELKWSTGLTTYDQPAGDGLYIHVCWYIYLLDCVTGEMWSLGTTYQPWACVRIARYGPSLGIYSIIPLFVEHGPELES